MNTPEKIISGAALLELLIPALSLDHKVRRIVLDIPFDDAVTVYIEQLGDERLLQINWPQMNQDNIVIDV